jgi:putative membrane protein
MFGLEIADLPHLNAILNSTATLLILAGLVAIKSKRERLHIGLMVLALLVSAAFLTSYLIYHGSVGHRETTLEGGTKTLCLVLLLTHVVLAAVIVPLILWTVACAVRGRREAHRRWARRTVPLWLYVSVTGVVIYFINF